MNILKQFKERKVGRLFDEFDNGTCVQEYGPQTIVHNPYLDVYEMSATLSVQFVCAPQYYIENLKNSELALSDQIYGGVRKALYKLSNAVHKGDRALCLKIINEIHEGIRP